MYVWISKVNQKYWISAHFETTNFQKQPYKTLYPCFCTRQYCGKRAVQAPTGTQSENGFISSEPRSTASSSSKCNFRIDKKGRRQASPKWNGPKIFFGLLTFYANRLRCISLLLSHQKIENMNQKKSNEQLYMNHGDHIDSIMPPKCSPSSI